MNPLQRAALRRKIYYFAAILALFTVSMFWRGMLDIPLSGGGQTAAHRFADRIASRTILDQSRRLELREIEQGDPEIMGTIARLALTGSRGFAVTLLWYDAIEKQKRNDFHEFEQRVRAVTTLQPHFITPWIFQSWNIAYNVSVEMHALGDMYFYIARGIELLAEGERRNRRSPDMRYQIAFYYQNKFGVSDQVQTLRCLFNLSCIPPNEWDPSPGNLTNADGSVNLVAFQKFCEDNPHLVRRLRGEERWDPSRKESSETLRCRTPADVIEFLRVNRKVPSRYRSATELADREKQFPILPEKFAEGPNEANPSMSEQDLPGGPAFSGFLAARAWFSYANTLVPPNPRDEFNNPIPSPTPQAGQYDAMKYRVPRLPMLIIFKQGPPRAQTYQAEMMQKDGWFDAGGWEVDASIDDNDAWFSDEISGTGGRRKKWAKPVVIGTGREWSREAWQTAAEMWRANGDENAQILSESRLQQLRADANIPPGGSDQVGYPPEPTPEQRADPNYMRWHRAISALFYYHQNRNVTNFPYYLASAETEQLPDTIEARKTLWQASQARKLGQRSRAVQLYEDGLEKWKQVLLKNPNFHRPEKLSAIEEQTYEYELEYIRLIALDDPRVRDKTNEVVAAARAVIPFLPEPFPADLSQPAPPWNGRLRDDLKTVIAEQFFAPFRGLMPDDLADSRRGTPWIREETKSTVLSRQGISRQQEPAADANATTPAGNP